MRYPVSTARTVVKQRPLAYINFRLLRVSPGSVVRLPLMTVMLGLPRIGEQKKKLQL
jgi:hypothetical protein